MGPAHRMFTVGAAMKEEPPPPPIRDLTEKPMFPINVGNGLQITPTVMQFAHGDRGRCNMHTRSEKLQWCVTVSQ